MNLTLPTKPGAGRMAAAFTLIELLVVISIIGILAALVVGISGVAIRKARLSRVTAELTQLESAIDNYQSKKGFYPPDNPNNPAIPPLFYELVGAVYIPVPAPPNPPDPATSKFQTIRAQTTISQRDVKTWFSRDGFVNASADQSEVRSFYPNLRVGAYKPASATPEVQVLVAPVEGPPLAGIPNNVNPWRYVSTTPTNNPTSYDLWVDIKVGRQIYRISNWSKEPVPL